MDVVIDSGNNNRYVVICTSSDVAYIMTANYIHANYDYDNVGDCENVWILNEWI